MPSLTLRAMREADLDLIGDWMGEPHIAKRYLSGSTLENELGDLRRCVAGEEPTHALVVAEDGRDVGWCQWYHCAAYPEHAVAVSAEADDIGIDYAIGDPARVGRGLGTNLITALVAHIRRRHPRAGLIADPEAANSASRRVLEKNGFELRDVRLVASEPISAPMAIYRLPPETGAATNVLICGSAVGRPLLCPKSPEEAALIVISVLVRRLKEGKTYEDFREAWLPDQGFSFPTRVVSAQRVDDDREVITIGFSELEEAEAEAQLQRMGPQQQRRHERIDAVIEPDMTRRFYVQVAEDDFTAIPSDE